MVVIGIVLSLFCLIICFIDILGSDLHKGVIATAGIVAGMIGLTGSILMTCSYCHEVDGTTPVVEIDVPNEQSVDKIVLIGDEAISLMYQPIMKKLSEKPEVEQFNDDE